MNKLPCGECKLFDPILGPGEKKTRRGQCVPRSVYPAREGPGQVFPTGVARVPVGELAKPFIVKLDQVVAPCEYARKANFDTVEEKKKRQEALTTRPDGTRAHS